jgi:polynucleotide 5'-kinase involved in rRNA processing
MTSQLRDFIKDPSTLEELISPRNRLIMVMGASDTGKTTLVECVARFLSGYMPLGVVDLDMGQSHIGPPATVAWGKMEERFEELSEIAARDFYFTGTITPSGSLLPSVAGAWLITARALSSCKKVVVDTTGLIAEPAGRILKQFKLDILRPDIVLALERSGELSHVLDSFRFHKRPGIFRLPVPDAVKAKSPARRGLYRFERIKKYFLHSRSLELSEEDTGIRFTHEPLPFVLRDLKNRIVSFRDDENTDIGLGFIEGIKPDGRKLLIRTPLGGVKFASVVIGRAVIDMADARLVDKR